MFKRGSVDGQDDGFIEGAFSHSRSSRLGKAPKIMSAIALLAGAALFLHTTLAANINLGTSTAEFGQGVVTATSCDDRIYVKPKASFVNAQAAGSFYLGSLEVSDVDATACDGRWFTFKIYDAANNTPLEVSSGVLSFSVLNTAGSYSTTQGGFSVTTNSSTSFTITFATPVATTSNVAKISLESSNNAPSQLTVQYAVGDTGPGGGKVFYTSVAGFNCGSTFSSTGSPAGGLCHYLEAAPKTWSGGSSDPTLVWATASYVTTDITGIAHDLSAYNNAGGVGLGYKNSTLIVSQGNSTASAAGAARAYTGGGKSDWYLPTTAELNLLCQWSRGMTQDVTALCTSGTDNVNFLTNPAYWSSSQAASDQARVLYFNGSGAQDGRAKGDTNNVRPIRAF